MFIWSSPLPISAQNLLDCDLIGPSPSLIYKISARGRDERHNVSVFRTVTITFSGKENLEIIAGPSSG